MSILIKGIPLGGYEISIMKDGERYRARVDGIWCEVEEITTTDTDSDTISRAKAIEAINKALDRQTLLNRFVRKVAIDAIKQLPPAQPERIRGHWVKISPANIYECSECGKNVMTNDICAYDFCHGCGADMREVTT